MIVVRMHVAFLNFLSSVVIERVSVVFNRLLGIWTRRLPSQCSKVGDTVLCAKSSLVLLDTCLSFCMSLLPTPPSDYDGLVTSSSLI